MKGATPVDWANIKRSPKIKSTKTNGIKNQNKKIVVVIFPLIELLGPNYPANDIHSKLQSYFKSQDVPIIDLLDELKGSNWKDLIASKFDTHPNEKVHMLAAEKLYRKLYPLLTM